MDVKLLDIFQAFFGNGVGEVKKLFAKQH